MNKSELNHIIVAFKEQLMNYQHQLDVKVLDKCPFVVQVGALTVTTDYDGRIITQNSPFPTQFSQKSVDQILSIRFENHLGEVIIPNVFYRNDWYHERIDNLAEAITLLEAQVNKKNKFCTESE